MTLIWFMKPMLSASASLYKTERLAIPLPLISTGELMCAFDLKNTPHHSRSHLDCDLYACISPPASGLFQMMR